MTGYCRSCLMHAVEGPKACVAESFAGRRQLEPRRTGSRHEGHRKDGAKKRPCLKHAGYKAERQAPEVPEKGYQSPKAGPSTKHGNAKGYWGPKAQPKWLQTGKGVPGGETRQAPDGKGPESAPTPRRPQDGAAGIPDRRGSATSRPAGGKGSWRRAGSRAARTGETVRRRALRADQPAP